MLTIIIHSLFHVDIRNTYDTIIRFTWSHYYTQKGGYYLEMTNLPITRIAHDSKYHNLQEEYTIVEGGGKFMQTMSSLSFCKTLWNEKVAKTNFIYSGAVLCHNEILLLIINCYTSNAYTIGNAEKFQWRREKNIGYHFIALAIEDINT